MLEIDEIIDRLSDRNLRVVSERTGLSYQTLWKFWNKKGNDNASYKTVKKLSDYLTMTDGSNKD